MKGKSKRLTLVAFLAASMAFAGVATAQPKGATSSMALHTAQAATTTELFVNSAYNAETEGYGVTHFSNYSAALTYASTNAKTATIVVEDTSTLSGNCVDQNTHKTLTQLGIVINDGAKMGNANSKWDMTYPVTIKGGGVLQSARPTSAGYGNTHVKNTLTIGEAGSDKKAVVDFINGSSMAYKTMSIAVLYNGKIVANNATISVGDLGLTGSGSFANCDIDVAGVAAIGKNDWYKHTMTGCTLTIAGNNLMNENTYYSNDGTVLNGLTMTDSTIVVGNDSETVEKVTIKNLTMNGSELDIGNVESVELTGTLTLDKDSKVDVAGTQKVALGSSAKIKINAEGATAEELANINAVLANFEITETSSVTLENLPEGFELQGGQVINPVAKVNGVGYDTFQAALDACVAGDNTVTLVKDITENVTVTQKEGVNVVIDGANYNFNGVMTVFGNGRQSGAETLTIKNVNFKAPDGASSCIVSPDRSVNNLYSYSHNVTVDNCTFSGNSGTAAIRQEDGGDKNWTVTNCTVDNTMHSFFQVNNVEGKLTVTNCEVYSKNGANLNSCTNVEMTGCTFDVTGYAVRVGVSSGGNLGVEKTYVLNNNTLKSECGDGDAVLMFRASAVDADVSMAQNVVSGTTHISGNTSATTFAANANY